MKEKDRKVKVNHVFFGGERGGMCGESTRTRTTRSRRKARTRKVEIRLIVASLLVERR